MHFADEAYSVKKWLDAFAKGIDPWQPAQSAQGCIDRNLSVSLNRLHVGVIPYYSASCLV